MKFALPFVLAISVFPLPVSATQSETFYVAARDGIYQGALDADSGKLAPLKLAFAADRPGYLALSPTRPVLFASFLHSVGAYWIQPGGTLALANSAVTGESDGCFVTCDRTGTRVYVAGYGQGSVTQLSLSANGTFRGDGAFAAETFEGTGPNVKRQEKSHVHSIYPDPEGRFLYVCDLGADKVWIVKPMASGPAKPFADVPPGSGPRHLAFSPDGNYVHVANKTTGTVTTFRRDVATGELRALDTVSNFPPETVVKGPATAEIVCHPSGKWLYVSNRGDNTISVFSLGADGRPTLIQCAPSVAKSVRSFWIDPAEKWIVAGGEADNRLVVLKIDSASGQLSPTDQSEPATKPQCILFVAPKH